VGLQTVARFVVGSRAHSDGAGSLRYLPKRLRDEEIQISIWQSHIRFGNRIYPGIVDEVVPVDPATLQ